MGSVHASEEAQFASATSGGVGMNKPRHAGLMRLPGESRFRDEQLPCREELSATILSQRRLATPAQSANQSWGPFEDPTPCRARDFSSSHKTIQAATMPPFGSIPQLRAPYHELLPCGTESPLIAQISKEDLAVPPFDAFSQTTASPAERPPYRPESPGPTQLAGVEMKTPPAEFLARRMVP